MIIRKIDEELIIIAGVIILGIVIVLGITTQTFKFSDGVSAISVVIAALALYYARRVKGPDFTVLCKSLLSPPSHFHFSS